MDREKEGKQGEMGRKLGQGTICKGHGQVRGSKTKEMEQGVEVLRQES